MTAAPELIVFGDADLLTGERNLHDDDLIITGQQARGPSRDTPNTIILRWADLGHITLAARTIDGRVTAHREVTGGDLFDVLTPGRALRELAIGATAGQHPSAMVPLFYVTSTSEGGGRRVYSRVDSTGDDACFLYIATVGPPIDDTDLAWLRAALDVHLQHASSLNSVQCYWRKAFPGKELEYKYALPAGTPIWTLAADTHGRVRAGDLAGLTPRRRTRNRDESMRGRILPDPHDPYPRRSEHRFRNGSHRVLARILPR